MMGKQLSPDHYPMHIVITGGTGFVGRRLVECLLAEESQAHHLTVLTRDVDRADQILGQQPRLAKVAYEPLQSQSWGSVLEEAEAVINLAGEPLAAGRWTPARKTEIQNSRIKGTQVLVEAIRACSSRPQVMISGSAVGYYGPQTTDQALDEQSPPGDDFLAQLSQEWEAAAAPVQDLGMRLALVRTGIVLGPGGGALDQLLGPFQSFVGGPLGSGQQWLSWIHREDLIRLVIFILNHNSCSGPFNGTAPQPVKMQEFCRTLGQVLGRPSWLPVPSFALELLLGEAAQVVLTGQRVLPTRAEQAGFTFEYPDLGPALQQILLT